jgi:hypothetical protein
MRRIGEQFQLNGDNESVYEQAEYARHDYMFQTSYTLN